MRGRILSAIVAMFYLLTCSPLHAQGEAESITGLDTLVITASPKEHHALREQPISYTALTPDATFNLSTLTAVSPSLYVPEYGSRSTAALYVRGVGSRSGTPAVGLYIDNAPTSLLSSYNTAMYDVDKVEVLRGAHAVLYGQGAMGATIRLHTKSPMSYQGTDLQLVSAGNYRQAVSLTHYHRISPQFAFSAGGFYDYTDGWLQNKATNKSADRGQSTGGRLHFLWKPTPEWTSDLNLNYQYSDEQGYAYGRYDKATGKTEDVAYNEDGSYLRNLLVACLNNEYTLDGALLSLTTNYEFLADKMKMDQDFTVNDIYTLMQRQRSHTISQEVDLRSSESNRRWDWLVGLYGDHQTLSTRTPVTFNHDGIATLIEAPVNTMMPASLNAQFDVLADALPFRSTFTTPTHSIAAYHQSTFNDVLTQGLSLTLGVRLDHEVQKLSTIATAPMNYDLHMRAMGREVNLGGATTSAINRHLTQNQTTLLPQASLLYKLGQGDHHIYASFSKGYRSGGFNIQMTSEVMQTELQADLTNKIRTDLQDLMHGMGAPPTVINQVVNNIPVFDKQDIATISYKPEYSYNYEVGTHLVFCENRYTVNASAFYISVRDQQLTRFADSGLGRQILNAGRSRSLGGELTTSLQLTKTLHLNAAYGFVHATFTNYQHSNNINYKGKRVPFSPKHTLSTSIQYTLGKCALEAEYQGIGRIYWTQDNSTSQPFYSLLNLKLSVKQDNATITFWGKNLMQTKYNTFVFNNATTRDNYFAQRGRPITLGATLTLNL